MPSVPTHSGEMSQNSERGPVHPSDVHPDDRPGPPKLTPAIDQAARTTKRMYEGLSDSSAGLEFGLSVCLAALFGIWLDGKLGTQPVMLLVFIVLGTIAGFRGLMRAVARAERAANRG